MIRRSPHLYPIYLSHLSSLSPIPLPVHHLPSSSIHLSPHLSKRCSLLTSILHLFILSLLPQVSFSHLSLCLPVYWWNLGPCPSHQAPCTHAPFHLSPQAHPSRRPPNFPICVTCPMSHSPISYYTSLLLLKITYSPDLSLLHPLLAPHLSLLPVPLSLFCRFIWHLFHLFIYMPAPYLSPHLSAHLSPHLSVHSPDYLHLSAFLVPLHLSLLICPSYHLYANLLPPYLIYLLSVSSPV